MMQKMGAAIAVFVIRVPKQLKMWSYKKQPVKLVYNYKRTLTTEVL
ncbi:MAG TPA: hypothetical protein VFH06_04155 [Candidatus Saccharimonadales bacterium]|nr:hypothetical protein [Candidatus Saccharimonadales bacterium]